MINSGGNSSDSFLSVWCVDPDLVYDKCLEREDGFENALDLFPPGYRPTIVQPEMSGELLTVFYTSVFGIYSIQLSFSAATLVVRW